MGTTDRSSQQHPDAKVGDQSDGVLLENFVARREETAFAALVQRYGPLVDSVCRRVLRHQQDAEDAFQATFLVLARKAGSIRTRAASTASLSGWLHRVAFRISLKARQRQVQRAVREIELEEIPEPEQTPAWVWRDLRPILDEEVNALPEKLRLPVILCHLEGKTNEEAARQLGCPLGTVLSRLSRARQRLRHRLNRRGLGLSAALLATLLSEYALAANFPPVLLGPTVGAAVVFVGGQSAVVSSVSTRPTALADHFLRGLRRTRLKQWAASGLAALALLGLLILLLLRWQSARQGAGIADEEKLRGAWRTVHMEAQGRPFPPQLEMRMIFGAGQCILQDPGGNELRMTFQLDPTREPKTIDLEYFVNNEKVIARGIYTLERDELTICYSFHFRWEQPPERPSRFVTHPGIKELLYSLKREKADPRSDSDNPAK